MLKKKYIKKVLFYTSLFGDYDVINNPPKKLYKNFDFYCVTDNKKKLVDCWKIITEKKNFPSKFLASRYYKILPFKINKFKKYSYSVYFDANIELKNSFYELLELFIESNCDMGLIKHPERKNIYEEAKKNLQLKNVSKKTVDAHNQYFKKYGYISKNDLTENCIIFRKNKKSIVKQTMNIWWKITEKFNVRDQHTLPFARFRTKVKTFIFKINLREKNKYVAIYPHSRKKTISRIKLYVLKKSTKNKILEFFIKFYLIIKNLFKSK